jgi:hypothetical protein
MHFSRLAHRWTAGKRALADWVRGRFPILANVTRIDRPPKVAIRRALTLLALSIGLNGAVAEGADKTERRLIGPLIDRTLAESTDPGHARLFSELRAKSVVVIPVAPPLGPP